MKFYRLLVCFLFSSLVMFLPAKLPAQVSGGGVPSTFSQALAPETEGTVDIVPPSADLLSREESGNPVPYRFGVNLPVDLDMLASGHRIVAPDGTQIWRLGIRSQGALALTLYFDRFNLPEGGRLFVYNPQRTQLLGAFTPQNNNNRSTFATALITGDRLILEYDAPAGTPDPVLHVSELCYAYRGITDYSGLKTGFGGSGDCEVNVRCSEGDNWSSQKRSVIRIQVKRGGSNLWCTGSLVNNTLNDGTPYVLTADHCGRYSSVTDISQWIFYFNYEGQNCPNPAVEPTSNTLTGATLISHGGNGGATGSDFFLVKLISHIPFSYNVYYNGWTRETLVPSPSGVGIHHPQGDIKKISTYTERLQPSNWSGGAVLSHWQVNWVETANGHGTTEGGSSGSPLFDNLGRLVGTLTGGDSGCDSSKLALPDYYGQFAYSWESNGTDSASVLKYWLDPLNTNVMSLNGWAVSVDEKNEADEFLFFPNPVQDILYIKCTSPVSKHLRLTISGLWGNTVADRFVDLQPGKASPVDISALPPGMYLARIRDGEQLIVRKIVRL